MVSWSIIAFTELNQKTKSLKKIVLQLSKLNNILYRIPWFVPMLFSLYLILICVNYFSFKPDINFLLVKQNLVNYIPWRSAFYVHVFAGILVMATGIFRARFYAAYRGLAKKYSS